MTAACQRLAKSSKLIVTALSLALRNAVHASDSPAVILGDTFAALGDEQWSA